MVYSAACWLSFRVKMQLEELCLPFHSIAANIGVAAQPGWRLLPLVNLLRLLLDIFAEAVQKQENLVEMWPTLFEDGWPDTDVGFREVWLSLCHFFFWPLSGSSAIFLSLFHVCFHISIFLVIIKEEIIPIIQVRRGAGSLTKEPKTSSFIRTTWLNSPPPNSSIEDFSTCYPAFSVPGLVDANVAGMSDFPLTPLQSLQESSAQTKQQQAAGSNSSPEYRKLAAESHMFAIPCVCTRVRVCFVFGISLCGKFNKMSRQTLVLLE